MGQNSLNIILLIMKTISMVRSSFEKGLGAFCGYVDSRLFRPPKTSHVKNSKRLKPLPCTAEAEQHYLKSFRLLLAPVDEMHIIGVNTQILKLAEGQICSWLRFSSYMYNDLLQ